jgi:hypothetical protein
LVRQFTERHVFIDVKVLYERLLQVPIVCLHSLRPTPPRRNRAFSQRFTRIGNHQLGIANQLGAKSMASRACSEVAVKGKMSRSQFADSKASSGVSVVSRVTQFLPASRWSVGVLECRSFGFFITPLLHYSITALVSQDNDAVPAPFERSLN